MQEKSRYLVSENQLKSRKGCNCKGRPTRVQASGETVIKGRVISMNPPSIKNKHSAPIHINTLVDSYNPIQESQSNQSEMDLVKEEPATLLAQVSEKDPILENETNFFKKMISKLKQFIR
ncbi:TPA: hypothetical protein QCU60_004344 [Bacillus cereus]|nr:hypothetical protein [Bacillus cereus]HDR6312357.1 hypothetical protein [Bacillus cereus]